VDYKSQSGLLTIPAGITSGLIQVSVYGDSQAESSETFTVRLTSPSGATLTRATGTGTILNDD